MNNDNILAAFGGKPVRDSYLPYGRQWLDQDDICAVLNVLKGEYLTTGPVISQFEKEIARYVGAKYAVTFSSGTAALHGACFAAGIASGDEVIVPALTFAASANCVLYQGGKPVFADIDPQTYNVAPGSIQKLITKNTKAIIPVDFTGQPVEHDRIQEIAGKYNLVIIEDAAHALGASYKGQKIGSISDMTMFSFHPVKHITAGEGGVITTNNKMFYDKLVQFRTHGITRERERLKKNHGPWYYEMHFLGYNYRMTDFQAALGISQLKKLELFLQKRTLYAEKYMEALQNIKQINLPHQKEGAVSSWHLFVIRVNLNRLFAGRKEIFEALQKENIGVNVHYLPVYLHPYYCELGYQPGLCPNAEQIYESIITLPLFPAMSSGDLSDVIKAVKKVLGYFSH
ncbi:MAG: UDP-4-amino-4,6-dideoxy-N-acetyl-beta-L-altrosamine transaminase [Bacillota bacterium]